MRCAWAPSPRRMLRGLRAYQGVNAHVQGLTCEQHATTGTVVPKTQTTSPVTPRFSAFFTEVVCTLGSTELQTATSPPPNGGNGVIRTSTRRRHADRQPLVLQNPHRHRHERAPEVPAAVPVGGGASLDNEPKRRSKVAARTARGRATHGAARPHGRTRCPENPRVHKQQPAPHSNT